MYLAYLLVFIHDKHKTANITTIKIVVELVAIPIMVSVGSKACSEALDVAAVDENKNNVVNFNNT